MDTIRQYQIFIQILESGNFTRAAETLGLPRSTVSTTLRTLEDRLGEQLLHRTTRQVSATPQGEQFLQLARDVVENAQAAETLFQGGGGPVRGRLRVNMTSQLAARIVIPNLHTFQAAHPALELELSASDRLIDPVLEGVDLVVRAAELTDSDLICRKIGDIPMASCASRAYLDQRGAPRTPDDLDQHVIVGYGPTGHPDARLWEGIGPSGPISRTLRSLISVDNTEAYTAAAQAALGIVQIPRIHLVAHTRDGPGQLVEVLPDFPPPPMPLSFVYPRRRRASPRLNVFMDWLDALVRSEEFVI
ncbi:LysR family transcriptional regulator [Oceanicaulis sp. LC35]|uniref:LysR family transcriptional regulator n=1 Tax=Oceanicaulis sp. LC35 TaxID=3349635 RepID=UPI003F84FF12